MNTIIINGRICNELELKESNGTTYVKFSVASRKRGGGDCNFFNCIAWKMTADNIVKFCKKGSMICIAGSINQNNYVKNDTKCTSWDVTINEVEFLPKDNEGRSMVKGEQPTKEKKTEKVEKTIELSSRAKEILDEDFPF